MVGIALLTLAPGRMGGSEVYARGLVRALAEHGTREYVVALPPGEDAAAGLPAVAAGAPARSRRPWAFARAAASPRALAGAAVVHFPLTIPVPLTRRPRIVTLHDMLHRDIPELVPARVRAFRRLAYDEAARRADRVIVPSEFVRERAVARLGLDDRRVRVIHHGLDHELFRAGTEPREPFLLYPARAWPHKNHDLLFAAFALVRRERPELELVLTGGGGELPPLPAGVRSLGVVPPAELASLYRRASALVFPSRYEGFGWPVLEAMASGCPVAAARGGALEEVAGGAAVLFGLGSAEDVVAGIETALADGEALSRRGVERARSFEWARAAELHDTVYAELER